MAFKRIRKVLVCWRNHGWKIEGYQGLGPNTGTLAPRARPEAALGMGAGGGRPLPLLGPGCHPGKCLKTQMLNLALWWLLRSLVGSLGRVYPSKQQACQGLNQFKNFILFAVVAPLLVRIKNEMEIMKQYLLWNFMLFDN